MSFPSKKEFIEKYKDTRPAVANFAECISRAYMVGVASFGVGCVSFHFTQLLFKDRLPYPFKVQLALTLLFGAALSYQVGRDRFKACQTAFLQEEGKLPYYTNETKEDISDL